MDKIRKEYLDALLLPLSAEDKNYLAIKCGSPFKNLKDSIENSEMSKQFCTSVFDIEDTNLKILSKDKQYSWEELEEIYTKFLNKLAIDLEKSSNTKKFINNELKHHTLMLENIMLGKSKDETNYFKEIFKNAMLHIGKESQNRWVSHLAELLLIDSIDVFNKNYKETR